MIKKLLLFSFCVLINVAAKAQEIQLVKDINTTPGSIGFNIENRVVANGKLFFLSYQQGYDNQLFVTDGTKAGTVRLTDISNGEDEPRGLVSANGYAFYKTWYNNSWWLFRSDGTKEGTIPFHRLSLSFYDESAILEINGTIYFSGSQDYQRNQLWKTDGTIAGTALLKDLGARENGSRIQDFYNFKGKLYFLYRSGINEGDVANIWSSDGTAAGTKAGASFIGDSFQPTAAGKDMYFASFDVLYKTNGTSITTLTSGLTNMGNPFAIGTNVYFAANDGFYGLELWKTDGSVDGTVLVKDINPGDTRSGSRPDHLTNLNGTLFFSASTGIYNEIWKSDGTAAGTVQVTNLNATSYVYEIESIIVAGDNLVFEGGYSDGKLWKTNGTATGTVVLADFPGGNPVLLGSHVLFTGSPATGGGLFRTDLTTAAPQRITDITTSESLPYNFTDANGTLYFTANPSYGSYGLWKSDGSREGTVEVQKMSDISIQIAATDGFVYYTESNDRNVDRIWRTSGTTGDAVLVADLSDPKFGVKQIYSLTAVGNTLYFILFYYSGRMELWKSEGTPVVTSFIRAFNSVSGQSFKPIAFKGQLYFGMNDQSNGNKIWKSNGTGTGTQIAPEFVSAGAPLGSLLKVSDDNLYGLFSSSTGTKLIKTDGTTAGTGTVASLPFSPASLFEAGGLFYITSITTEDGKKSLWRTDGTVNGTFQLAVLDIDLNPDPDLGSSLAPFRLQTNVNGKLFFIHTDPALGDQVWVSDGTVAGTHRLTQAPQKDVRYFTQHTESLDGVFYFDYYEPATGREIWRSDGTSEGTRILEDLTPDGNTGVIAMKTINKTLLISANTGQYGYELYKISPVPAGPVSLRINSGGAAFTASGSRAFSADQYFTGTTQVSNAIAGDITATADDQLYKEQRFGSSFSYNVPVTNGTYNVVLHFAEIYWGIPSRSGTTGTARRQFHVNIEGARKLTNYDIFVNAGGAMRAGTETFPVTVTDGILNIDFLKGAADNPIIAAIEVVPTQVTLGPLADAYIRNTPHEATNYGTAGTLEVKTGSLPSYQRGTYLKFPLAGVSQVNSAKLRLYGYNAQSNATIGISAFGVSNDDWTETGINWSNAPVSSAPALGSVNVNGTARYYEIDVTAFVKSQLAGDKTVSLFVTNPANQNVQLNFNSRENATNKPQLVITSLAPPAARSGVEEEIVSSETEPEVSGIYPNPAGRRFTIQISKAHQGKVDFQLIGLSGNTYQISPVQPAAPASKVDMDISSIPLPKGIYILKIQSNAFKERVKLLLTE
ncbi:malectin domain-containing carbohydrate-binding protein [Dyadobacter sp. NIV53]|uniref:CBM96 family carbohydrate-binding protein n=1 Tax=Dyadobacter sp. NIV53 TaxID=2861765 RepID=UPI001C87914E|nr:malectin domain-containing carbohydrate-binding protein [Dyadobacter sp. NIV53]